METDYMDPDTVQNFIDAGFSLGFHGHQHRPQFLDTRFRHGQNRKISVISAGTLCGDAALRFGRSYNIVELNISKLCGRLHLREMQNDNLLMPIWGPSARSSDRMSYLDFEFDPPLKPFFNRAPNTKVLTEARRAHDKGDFRSATDILMPIFKTDPLARRLVLDCLKRLNDRTGIITTFDPPDSPEETITLMDALWREGKRDRLKVLVESDIVTKSKDPSVAEMRNKFLARIER